MARELKHLGGVGVNIRLAVMEDGRKVGVIQRGPHGGFRVYGHYHRTVTGGRSLPEAKLKAMDAHFPTPQEAYEAECEVAYQRRREQLEKAFAPHLYRMARQLLDGSNLARHELQDLIEGIEKAARSKEPFERGTEDRWKELVMGVEIDPLSRWPTPPEAGNTI